MTTSGNACSSDNFKKSLLRLYGMWKKTSERMICEKKCGNKLKAIRRKSNKALN